MPVSNNREQCSWLQGGCTLSIHFIQYLISGASFLGEEVNTVQQTRKNNEFRIYQNKLQGLTDVLFS